MTFRLLGENIPKEVKAKLNGFKDRNIFIDCRGTLRIHPAAEFGFNIRIYTQSHDINNFRIVVDRPVIIEKEAFIASDCILYNCTIGEKAIVSIGSLVKSVKVPPNTIVAGNPLKIVAIKKDNKWVYLINPKPVKETGE